MGIMKFLKVGLGTIAGTGASMFIGGIATNVINRENVSVAKKLCMFVGASVMGMMVGDAVDKYVENGVDNIEKSITEIKNAFDQVNNQNSEEEENG